MVSVATTGLYHCSAKLARENVQTNGQGCVPIKLNLQKQVVHWIWSSGRSLLIPGISKPCGPIPSPNYHQPSANAAPSTGFPITWEKISDNISFHL